MPVHDVNIIILNYVSYVILLLFKFRPNLFAPNQSCVLFVIGGYKCIRYYTASAKPSYLTRQQLLPFGRGGHCGNQVIADLDNTILTIVRIRTVVRGFQGNIRATGHTNSLYSLLCLFLQRQTNVTAHLNNKTLPPFAFARQD